ncbi:hypothetical protein, partial [Burkholderia pseudomallei]|uniref:hypothetical protein n=1 Tax=Burkholderia pseudomallei TaxID=28450 RepID=UPI001CC2727D
SGLRRFDASTLRRFDASTPRMQARFRRRSISRRLSRASRGGARNRLYRRCRFSPHPYAA